MKGREWGRTLINLFQRVGDRGVIRKGHMEGRALGEPPIPSVEDLPLFRRRGRIAARRIGVPYKRTTPYPGKAVGSPYGRMQRVQARARHAPQTIHYKRKVAA